MEVDTIAAVASPEGRSRRGILRLSGPAALTVIRDLFSDAPENFGSYAAADGALTVEGVGVPCTCYVMRAPRSYTREDVVEFHLPGSPPLLRAALQAALAAGPAAAVRLAAPGEFTRRAFLHGRIDLAQAEAVLQVIRSRHESELRRAVGQLGGSLSRRLQQTREALVRLLSRVEASLDFSEQDIEVISAEDVAAEVARLAQDVTDLLGETRPSAPTGGVATVLLGRPNVGKSSLLNALLARRRAIVTPVPGTTRDLVEETLALDGIAFRLIDTAGIGRGGDALTDAGIARARERLAGAQLVLFLLDGSRPITDLDRALWQEVPSCPGLVVINKQDLPPCLGWREIRELVGDAPVIRTSCVTGDGLPALSGEMVHAVVEGHVDRSAHPFLLAARQREHLTEARGELQRAGENVSAISLEFIAEDLRQALICIGRLTGEAAPDEILDLIFAEFCVGK